MISRNWRALIALALLASVPISVRAQDGGETTRLFNEANRAYEKSDYESAAHSYEQIVQSGIHNAVVYYNLGNTYFKLNQLGRAILFYERARRLAPGDADTAENLAFVSNLRVDQIEKPENPFWLTMLVKLHNLIGLENQIMLCVMLWILANGGLMLRILRHDRVSRQLSGIVMIGTLLVLIPTLLSVGIKLHQRSQSEGVVLAEKVDLLSGPGEDNPVLVSIHEGLKVEIRNATSEWFQIVLPNGWNGWVPRSSLEPI